LGENGETDCIPRNRADESVSGRICTSVDRGMSGAVAAHRQVTGERAAGRGLEGAGAAMRGWGGGVVCSAACGWGIASRAAGRTGTSHGSNGMPMADTRP
jgi:hypothetical protein